jgi:hypothetical protein
VEDLVRLEPEVLPHVRCSQEILQQADPELLVRDAKDELPVLLLSVDVLRHD